MNTAAILFRAIQAALLPVAAAGYVPFVVRTIGYSRRTGTSGTILASFYTRWMQHQLGTRSDEPCARLMDVLPTVSPLALRLTTAPTLVAHRLTGHVPRIYRYPYPGEPPMMHQQSARTTFYDQALARRLGEVEQLVVLGAGLDTRAYRHDLRTFEVDTPRTQALKRQMVELAGLDGDRVSYVPADFSFQDWLPLLQAAGFDPRRRTFFLWESVSMYLDREAVESTLRKIATTAPGSTLAFDYFSSRLLGAPSAFMRYARAVLQASGEPFGTFALDADQVKDFLSSCGLALEEQRHFGGGMAGFAVARVPR